MTVLACACSTGMNCKAQKPENFKFIIDEFADCKVMKYQLPDWDSLSLNQKRYIYCHSQAA